MLSLKQKLIRAAAATTAVGAVAAAGLAGGSPTNADPKQYTDPLYGYGSDTIQDITNAFAGWSNDVDFTPLRTTNGKQIVSWDAFPADSCISPVIGAPTILRPNGSTNGQRVLSSANNGFSWPHSATALCGGQKNVSGMVDFARSSSGPNAAGTAATFIPFGRDALSFAYLRPSGSPVTNISAANLKTLHDTGPLLIGGVPVLACGIQTGSGTYDSWMDRAVVNGSGVRDAVGTAICNGAGGVPDTGGRLQENNGPELTAKGALLGSMVADVCDGVVNGVTAPCDGSGGNPQAQLIVGFSASQYVARSNNVGAPNPGLEGTAGGGLGDIDGLNFVNCTSPTSCSPDSAAYASTTWGRNMFYVLP
ncbi:MAG: hypothetical protein ACLGHQ_07070, partial [Acidimicrobiia bacterium]